jgi:hypothetical protein
MKLSKERSAEKKKIIMKRIFWIILIVLSQACVAKKRLEPGVNAVMNRATVIPIAVAQFVTEASSKIYSIDTLTDKTTALIKTFDVRFYSKTDSLQLNFKDFKFYYSGDSVYYENFIFPKWDFSKYADTMRSVINCFYTTPRHSEVRCLTGIYIVTNGRVLNHEQYKFCSFPSFPQCLHR